MASSTPENPKPEKTATSQKAAPRSPDPERTELKRTQPRRALLGKKIGMTQVYSDAGQWVPVTVLLAGPCTVLQVKTVENDGYAAIQVGFDDTKKKRKGPQQALLDRIGTPAKRFVREIPLVDDKDLLTKDSLKEDSLKEDSSAKVPESSPKDAPRKSPSEPPSSGGASTERASTESEPAGQKKRKPKEPPAELDPRVGATIGVSIFKEVPRVDVRGVTKGRGFSGVIRRHHFNAGPKSHGTKNIREPKSTGMHTDPGRVHKGKRMPGHLGAALRKVRNLDVVKVVEGDNLLLVKGSIPGPNGGYVYIQESLK